MEITYGLYLSDHSILDGIDTELVVLSGIMIQNLRRETGWHLRGTRRIGVSFDDVEKIQQCVSVGCLKLSVDAIAENLTDRESGSILWSAAEQGPSSEGCRA